MFGSIKFPHYICASLTTKRNDMKKVAVVIKHAFRDRDYRVDIYEVSENLSNHEVVELIEKRLLGNFQVIAITDKVDLNCKL